MFRKNKEVILDNTVRFSKSTLWQDQKKYYANKGIYAWQNEVPSYVTSNPFIGKSYAKLIVAFMQDWLKKQNSAIHDSFYIIEFGAGSGKFSFYCIKNIVALLKSLQLTHIKFCYVITDATTASFDFLKKHPALQSFIQNGQLDFAECDLYHVQPLTLQFSNVILDKNRVKNPLLLIANYIFDSLATDIFHAKNSQLHEVKVTVKKDDADETIDFSKLHFDFEKKEIDGEYYGNAMDAVLFDYQNTLKDSYFQFPVAVIAAIEKIREKISDQLIVLSSDKGYTNTTELENCTLPRLVVHGSFSIMMNYHALGAYFKNAAGDYYIQSYRASIVTGAFSMGLLLADFPFLYTALQENIGGLSPVDYFCLEQYFHTQKQHCDLVTLSALMNLSSWDPDIFNGIAEKLRDIAYDKKESELIHYFVQHVHLIADNFYYLPFSGDVLFNIGHFLLSARCYHEAIAYFEKSKMHFGECLELHFNVGLCYYHLNQYKDALGCYQAALQFDKNSPLIHHWIEKLSSFR